MFDMNAIAIKLPMTAHISKRRFPEKPFAKKEGVNWSDLVVSQVGRDSAFNVWKGVISSVTMSLVPTPY